MIEEPPLLTIKAVTQRPSQEQIEALRGTPTGILTDAMQGRGALDPAIRPLCPDILPNQLCGPALTCLCGPADMLALFGALAEVQAGDVVVVSTGDWHRSAVVGDRVLGMLKNSNAAGFVTDGMVRDMSGILSVGLPVMCAGVSPNSPFAKGPGEIGFAVQLGGVNINSGDMIVSDADGVVVIPYKRIDDVIASVKTIRKLEEELDAKVAAGLTVPEHVLQLLASDRVQRV